MPWSSQGGGGSGGPWGQGSGGGSNGSGRGGRGGGGGGGRGNQPPNFDDLIKKSQDRFKGMMPGGLNSFRGIVLLVLVGVGIWLFTGFYRVQPEEQGVELVFGKWVDTTAPGLNYNLPAPIGIVYKPKVTNVNRTEVGFRGTVDRDGNSGNREIERPHEALMLTGDENIIDIRFVVFWKIDTRLHKRTVDGKVTEVQDGVQKFLFNVRNPVGLIHTVSESAMREVIGKSEFEFARTSGRAKVAAEVLKLIQQLLDEFGAGIEVQDVQLQKIDPPANVLAAFKDVQAARADKERAINEANAYKAEVVQRAEGNAQQVERRAEAYKEERIRQAEGEAARFLSVFAEYRKQKDVTRRRIYLETMRDIMAKMDKVLIDNGRGGAGVVPYLPLNELKGSGGSGSSAAGGNK